MIQLQLCFILGFYLSGYLFDIIETDFKGINPCSKVRCAVRRECRLRRIFCLRAPCQPQAICLPVRPSTARCPIGKPVVGGNGRDIQCSYRTRCPDLTFCVTDYRGRSGCCLQQFQEYIFVKPGFCPRPRFKTSDICIHQCSRDSSCPKSQKCCSNGCGNTCQIALSHDPTIPKPGFCPRPRNRTQSICTERCSSDNSCPGSQKCCSNGCGKSCQHATAHDPTIIKPGFCQKPRNGTKRICTERCSSDNSCPGSQKCCSNGCGKTCQHVLTHHQTITKPGLCPRLRFGRANACAERCSSDNNCPGSQKCCSTGCGKSCQNVLTNQTITKPGLCPRPRFGRASTCTERCSSDRNCPGSQKCCSNGCGKTCQNALAHQAVTKPGSCPRPVFGSASTCTERCSSDNNCPGSTKCCSNGCGKTCHSVLTPHVAITKPGLCPRPRFGRASTCTERCSSDNNCLGNQKCCSNGCGKTCQHALPHQSVIEKPGFCPSYRLGTSNMCTERCSNDNNCPGSQKCCSNGCGRMCQNALSHNQTITKPGLCPISRFRTGSICIDQCASDSSCPGSQKCCNNGCAKTCQHALPHNHIITKPGLCPRPTFGTRICTEQCSSDYSCPGSQKCCSNGCGKTCQNVTTPKPGICPRKRSRKNNNGMRCGRPCSTDIDCLGRRKCCGSHRCGRICQLPKTIRTLCSFGNPRCKSN